ncbi:MAG: caspase family protein [Candidatus Rokubacteria bacterium]|nr:caspase family protein [Candidatus Rokubacteria bacterium]
MDHESIGLAGLVSGGKGVSRVVVTLNGVEVSRLEERTPQSALPVNLPIKLREGQNTLVVTATEADGRIHQEVRTVHYEKLVPLSVAFRYPEDRSRVSEEASVVAAVITSSKGVAKVSVILNGVEVHQQSERTPQKSLVVTAPLTLREGANAIVVTAAEPDGTLRQEIRTVIYDPPKVAVAVPPPPAPPTRDRWAVVIGAGRYESPEIPQLRYTVPDAEAIYQILTGPAGFKKEHVLLLTDKTEKKPTLRNIKWALGTFLARSAKKDDTVLIFFAGHGAPEVDQRGVERDGFAKYLVPIDAEPDDLYSTALPMDELQTVFARNEAERVVVFLDTCYSGAAGGRTFASKKTRATSVDDQFLERLTRSKGRAIITASRPAEVSIELPELGHGIFTYYLVQALKGAGDLNRDGIVSLQELYEYVEQQVTQKSRAVGGNQHPVMKGELEGVLPLVKVSGR